jgi:hypothetical protein
LACVIVCAVGCGTRVLIVDEGGAIFQLREDVPDVKVWLVGADERTEATVTLPAGWYCLSDKGGDGEENPD